MKLFSYAGYFDAGYWLPDLFSLEILRSLSP